MVKKILLISLVCLGLSAFMASQVSAGCCCNPRFCAKWIRGSDKGEFTAYGDPEVLDDATVLMRVFADGTELTGTVICARWSPYKFIRDLRIKKCRRHPWRFICRSETGQTIDYNNADPIVAEGRLDCGDSEAICTETLEIFFDDAEIGDQGQDICDGLHPGKWVYADFKPDFVFNEGIIVGEENLEGCPIIDPDLLVIDACNANGVDGFSCDEVLDPTDPVDGVPDYPGGFGPYEGYGGYGGSFDVCYYWE